MKRRRSCAWACSGVCASAILARSTASTRARTFAARISSEGRSRRRRGCDVDVPWRQDARLRYDEVWPRDLADAFDGTDGVEPVASVCERLRAMVDVLEARHSGADVVLTAHADVIQIFQTWFAGADVRGFSQYRFANGEVRECDVGGANLPEGVPMRSQRGVAA